MIGDSQKIKNNKFNPHKKLNKNKDLHRGLDSYKMLW
tara:strand:- start:288 stop:398 length:111 start_codon:yes stop_codon:yes gene_type:complete